MVACRHDGCPLSAWLHSDECVVHLKESVELLDRRYAEAAEFDRRMGNIDTDEEDEMTILRKAALSRGQP